MTVLEDADRAVARQRLVDALLARRVAPDHWDGRLASSALSTATAILALDLVRTGGGARNIPAGGPVAEFVAAGARWLVAHQNEDGGWGDTIRSRSNISTTAIVWAALSVVAEADSAPAIGRARGWLDRAAGGSTPDDLRDAILRRYGNDRTFSVPILTLLALAGKLASEPIRGWRSVPQLPFELAVLPHRWFQHLSLPVVSYALPALIAIGQVRHRLAPSRNPVTRTLRNRAVRRTLRVLHDMQPASGGYLEATPLTSFVVMSLAGMGEASHPVADAGVRFLTDSMRDDGSWPIDSNLATWVTTLSIGALSAAGAIPEPDRPALTDWVLMQQSEREHPFTHAAAGAWAWTPLSGGVPDADDTSGALLALWHLASDDPRARAAAARGIRWLLGLQNRDGGIPTFCRGWGTLPFDQSTPEITAHALQAWSVWFPSMDTELKGALRQAADRALSFVVASQRTDGAWIPLWFGNEQAPDDLNPTYGTARVVAGLQSALVRDEPRAVDSARRGVEWLLAAQNADGGWGGGRGVVSSLEETGVVVSTLGSSPMNAAPSPVVEAVMAGGTWLARATMDGKEAAPIGLYFAQLWYYEELYPLVFALSGLAAASSVEPLTRSTVTS
jgi:squalene-hopene/tetraprenyl-beta-curcumene cyclase